MTQIIMKKGTPVKIEELYVILLKKFSEEKEKEDEEFQEQYEFFKNLNPRYFEEGIPLKEALERQYLSDIRFSSGFNIFRSIGY